MPYPSTTIFTPTQLFLTAPFHIGFFNVNLPLPRLAQSLNVIKRRALHIAQLPDTGKKCYILFDRCAMVGAPYQRQIIHNSVDRRVRPSLSKENDDEN